MSISTSLTWNITNAIRDNSDGFVTEIRYSITGVSTESTNGRTYTHVIRGGYLVPDHTRKGDEIDFDKLTESKIIEWLKAGMGADDVAMYEDIISKHLKGMHDGEIDTPENQYRIDNNSSNGLPW
jgi:hypothetical protein